MTTTSIRISIHSRRWLRITVAASHPQQLRHALEVLIASDQQEIMLQHQRRNPEVVVGNRRPGTFELYKNTRIVLGRFPRRKQNSYRRFGQEALQKKLVALLLRSRRKIPP